MVREKYQGIAFSKPFIEEIKNHIKNNSKYTTVTAFIRFAVLKQLELEKNLEER